MSKNLTLKGAAFGALVALSISAVAPASAAGLADTSFVSLTPKTGTEYAVPANANQTFTLSANEASSIEGTNRNLKFLVTDADEAIEPTNATSSRVGFTTTTSDTWDRHATNGTVTVTDASGAAAGALAVGDMINVTATNFTAATDGVAAGIYKITAVATNGTTFSFNDGVTGAPGTPATAAEAIEVVREARATDKSYVVDTGSYTSASSSDLVLKVAGGTSRTATVTAWVDNNGNDLIDSTEYVSPTREVKFLAAADITVTTVVDPLVLGATSIGAKITTSPVLNGNQFAYGTVTTVFTRQGSSSEVTATAANAAAWSDTTKQWSTTQTLTDASDNIWTGLSTNRGAIASATNSTTTVTINTVVPHGLTTGDTVSLTGLTATTNAPNDSSVSVTVSDADTFTYTSAGTATGTIGVSSAAVIGVESAVAGTYSAKGILTVNSVAKASTVASATLGAASAASVTNSVVGSKDLVATSTTAATVRKGVKSVVVTSAAVDADEKAVGAGIPATITATTVTSAGTVKVNGTTVTSGTVVPATTDASGKVVVTVDNASALAGESVVVSVNVQGKAAATTLTWAAAQYTLIDKGDSSTASSRVRAIAKGGSYTFNLAVLDQWKQPIADGYRVKAAVTDRTVSTTFHNIVSGAVSFAVADGAVTANDIVVALTVEKQVGSTAAALVDADVVEWSGASGSNLEADVATVAIKVYDQTNGITLNADGAASADLSVDVALLATKAANGVLSTDLQGTYTTSAPDETATITGTVASTLTALKYAGGSITVSGDSSILFSVGNVDAFGSLTFIDADGDFSINAYSNKALTNSVVTITAGGATKTVKVSFLPLAAKTATISGPNTIKAGRAISLDVKFADKWGNLTSTGTAGTATFTSTGPGWLTATGAVTSVEGVSNVKLITSPEEGGVAVVTATTNVNDAAGVAIKTTKQVLVGITASVSAGSKKANVVVKNASGATVKVVSGSKSLTKTATSDSYKLSLTKLTAGKKTVKVYVNDVLVSSKSVTVKR